MPMIDRYVIEHAAARAYAGRSVHVNLSATTIAHRGLFHDIVTTVDRYGAPPGAFTFEISEAVAGADLDRTSHLTAKLVERGFRIALDGFRGGSDVFRYLKTLPVSVAKIDAKLVRALSSSVRTVATVRTMVARVRLLDHGTIALGVEDERTLELVRSLGVDCAQGFHVGRPQPVG
jgi:EAL domain-containing protein (putative c-di-GMP-specific phosphodiesterase class I)